MNKSAIALVVAISGIVAVAVAIARTSTKHSAKEIADNRSARTYANGLGVSIESDSGQITFVDRGGFGEQIHLRICLSASDWDWERLTNIEGLGFEAKPSMFQIMARKDGGAEFQVKPSAFNFVGSRGDGTVSEWHYNADVLLSETVQDREKPSLEVTIRVLLAEDYVARITRVERSACLASNLLWVELRPQPFAASNFTERLHSLSPEVTTDDVRRILGQPISNRPVVKVLQGWHPKYAYEWEYRNPDFKGEKRAGKDGDMVTLYFDAAGRLVEYAESIYGC